MPTLPTVAKHVVGLDNAYTTRGDASLSDPWSQAHLIARKLGSHATTVLLADEQKYIIQVVATTMASISITAAFVALYWFCLMRRNYRRDLILLLILSDLFKNFCYILFSGVSLTQGQIQSADVFCQASGYMLQTGLEACDFAVLFISLHMVLQIFPLPNTIIGYEGLYNVRHWVYLIWFSVPNLTASLAFINDNGAYQVQGAWCWLPVRPFWYRLALSWVPRYVITATILCFAITIYVHVGKEIKVFGAHMASGDGSSTSNRRSNIEHTDTGSGSMASTPATRLPEERQSSILANLERSESHTFEVSSIRDRRRASLPTWHSPFEGLPPEAERKGSQSAETSRRGSRQVTFDFAVPEEVLSPMQQPSTPISPLVAPRLPVIPQDLTPIGPTLPDPVPSKTVSNRSHPSITSDPMQKRRRAIKRQVKSLFVYPIAYLLFWIIPFIMHCMNYVDYYAQNPVFAISLLSSLCTTSLGLVDVVIFSWREQPWKHIAGSDGTFFGSFCFWRCDRGLPFSSRRRAISPTIDVPDEKGDQSKGLVGLVKNSWRRLSSTTDPLTSSEKGTNKSRWSGGGSDSQVRAREMAQQRLAREREVHTAQARADVEDVPTPQSPGGRNWFDDMSEINIPYRPRRPTWTA